MGKSTAKELTIIALELSFRESGTKIVNMDLEFILTIMEKNTKGTG
jgi:hypothetical protein